MNLSWKMLLFLVINGRLASYKHYRKRSGVFQGSFNSNSIPVTILRPHSLSGVAFRSQSNPNLLWKKCDPNCDWLLNDGSVGTLAHLVLPASNDRHFNQSINFYRKVLCAIRRKPSVLNWYENNPVSCRSKALQNPWTELRLSRHLRMPRSCLDAPPWLSAWRRASRSHWYPGADKVRPSKSFSPMLLCETCEDTVD